MLGIGCPDRHPLPLTHLTATAKNAPAPTPPSRESGFVLGSVSTRSTHDRRTAGIVKGFRMPAGHRREGMHGGRRPKSLEGGNRGGVCAGGGVGLWGFSADALICVWLSDRDAGRVSSARVVLVGLGADRDGDVALRDLRFARSKAALTVAVGGAWALPARYRRRTGAAMRRWRHARVGHELSSPIDGMGHSRGWQPGSKVSMMIIRPPQQGQAFHSSSS